MQLTFVFFYRFKGFDLMLSFPGHMFLEGISHFHLFSAKNVLNQRAPAFRGFWIYKSELHHLL